MTEHMDCPITVKMRPIDGYSDQETIWPIIDSVKNGSIILPDLEFKIVGYEVETKASTGMKFTLIISPTKPLKLDELLEKIKK